MKIKPCPFCGGEAELNTMGAMCKNKLCGAVVPGFGTTAVLSTIKCWNTRSVTPLVGVDECPCGTEFESGVCPNGHDFKPVDKTTESPLVVVDEQVVEDIIFNTLMSFYPDWWYFSEHTYKKDEIDFVKRYWREKSKTITKAILAKFGTTNLKALDEKKIETMIRLGIFYKEECAGVTGVKITLVGFENVAKAICTKFGAPPTHP